MLSGASGIDAVLVVVSAQAGVMPQTREHLKACQVIGVTQGVVALTFADRCDDIDKRMRLIREQLQDTVAQGFEMIPVSAPSDYGVTELSAAMGRILDSNIVDESVQLPVCMPIDRVFSQPGFGTIVTGSLLRGRIECADELYIVPGDEAVRVRGLHVHGQSTDSVHARCRIACNINQDAHRLPKGAWLVSAKSLHVGRVFDAQVAWLAHNGSPLRRRRSLSVHIGVNHALADVHADGYIEVGTKGTARIRLDRAIPLPRMVDSF